MSVAVTSDGKTLASGSWDNTVKLWDVTTGKERSSLSAGTSQGVWVAFPTNGRALVSGGPKLGRSGLVKFWDTATGKERTAISWDDGLLWAVAITPDGKTLATTSDSSIKLWTVPAGR